MNSAVVSFIPTLMGGMEDGTIISFVYDTIRRKDATVGQELSVSRVFRAEKVAAIAFGIADA